MLHPEIQKAVQWAQARITGGADIETVLAQECHPALSVPEFAVLVNVKCASMDLGLKMEAAIEASQQRAYLIETGGWS